MTIVSQQLGLPAVRMARHQARTLAADAAGALARLDSPDDPDALHDARVALRRLRSWLRAFESEIALPRAVARRLRRLARATGGARDLEVAVERLQELARRSRGARRAALSRLAAELASRRDADRPALRREVAKRWRSEQRPLMRALTAGEHATAPRFATLIAARLAAAATPFAKRPPAAADWPALHRLRIAGKRARYLLEPLRGVQSGAERALTALKGLQEHLGAINDAVVLEALLVDHAAHAARAAALAPQRASAAARTLRDAGLAVAVVRDWRARLARLHHTAVVRRMGKVHGELAGLVAELRTRRFTSVSRIAA